jgi:hypothetical protein
MDMEKEDRQKIAKISQQIDNLAATRDLITTSNVLCFTTMDRSAEETVSIEFEVGDENVVNTFTNGIIRDARIKMIEYLDSKIYALDKEIDKIIKKSK